MLISIFLWSISQFLRVHRLIIRNLNTFQQKGLIWAHPRIFGNLTVRSHNLTHILIWFELFVLFWLLIWLFVFFEILQPWLDILYPPIHHIQPHTNLQILILKIITTILLRFFQSLYNILLWLYLWSHYLHFRGSLFILKAHFIRQFIEFGLLFVKSTH